MRVAEGRAGADRRPASSSAGDGADQAHLQRLGGVRSGSRPGSRAASMRLAGARRPDQQQVVRPRRRDLEGALGALLPPHLGQAGTAGRARAAARAAAGATAPGAPGNARSARSRSGAASTSVAPAQAASAALRGRADEAQLPLRGRQRRGQHARHRPDRPVQRQFPERRVMRRPRPPGCTPMAASRPSAIGRSKWLPSFSRSAGARFTRMRLGGSDRPSTEARPAPAPGSPPPPCSAGRPR